MSGRPPIPDLPSDAYPGDRVVVRYLLHEDAPADWRRAPNPSPGPAGAPTMSDITGFVVERGSGGENPHGDSTALHIERDGVIESVPRTALVSVRLLSARPVRNSEIRDLEHAAALAWPGVESAWIAGWLARAGAGFSRRANSAVPLDRSARADASTLRDIAAWYRARDLPVLLALPERLITPRTVQGTPASPTIHVLTRDLDPTDGTPGSTGVDVALDPTPSTAWSLSYGRPGTDTQEVAAVVSAARGPVTFATVVDETASVIATGRAAVTVDPSGVAWLGITALWTATAHRRRHIADAVLARLMAWGAHNGAQVAYVQVEADNAIAGRWYRRRGFALHHTSHYEMVD